VLSSCGVWLSQKTLRTLAEALRSPEVEHIQSTNEIARSGVYWRPLEKPLTLRGPMPLTLFLPPASIQDPLQILVKSGYK
jgi:hypothetical protein